MSESASKLRRAYIAALPLTTWLFALPGLGYALRLVVGILKLPRLNMHLRRLDVATRRLETATAANVVADAHIASLTAQVAALNAQVAALNAHASPLDARVAALEGAWRQHIPAFLNAVATVPAFARELARMCDSMERTVGRLDAAEARSNAISEHIETARRHMEQTAIRLDNADASTTSIWEQIGAWRERMERTVVRLDNADASNRSIWEQIRASNERMEQAIVRLDNADASTRSIWERIRASNERMEQALVRLDGSEAAARANFDRIELVRREFLFELAHGAARRPQESERATATRIVAPDKVAAARAAGALRLNLGCGHIALPDYVNVDMRELPGVDVIAEIGDLPFERSSVDEIFSAHLVEHFPQEAMRRRLLPYWRDLIRPGGVFRAITPDAAAMLAGAGAGTYGFEEFREVVFGSQDYDGDYHYNLFTPDSFRSLLDEAGFRDIEVPVIGRRNGKCFEFEISARRP